MGKDIHVRLTKLNKETNLYEELALYKPGIEYHYDKEGNKIIDNPNFQKIYIYDGRNYEMFDGMKEGDEIDGYGNFPWTSINLNSLEPKLKKEIEEKQNIQGYFDFYETTLADIKLYLYKHPTVVNYEAEEEEWEEQEKQNKKPRKINPIQHLFQNICDYGYFADNWNWGIEPLSVYKVLFYFDW